MKNEHAKKRSPAKEMERIACIFYTFMRQYRDPKGRTTKNTLLVNLISLRIVDPTFDKAMAHE